MEFRKFEYETFDLVSYYKKTDDGVLVVTDSLSDRPVDHVSARINTITENSEPASEEDVPSYVREVMEEKSNE